MLNKFFSASIVLVVALSSAAQATTVPEVVKY